MTFSGAWLPQPQAASLGGNLGFAALFRVRVAFQTYARRPRAHRKKMAEASINLALEGEEENPPEKKSNPKIKSSSEQVFFSEQFPFVSSFASQGRGQKFARTFRKSSRERGVFWGISGFGVGCWPPTRSRKSFSARPGVLLKPPPGHR